jgi:hypothetical protein
MRQNVHNTPEMRLVSAIFADAVWCLTGTGNGGGGRRRRDVVEAQQWLQNDKRDWLFAFNNVCDLLGLDAAAVRERLRRSLPE